MFSAVSCGAVTKSSASSEIIRLIRSASIVAAGLAGTTFLGYNRFLIAAASALYPRICFAILFCSVLLLARSNRLFRLAISLVKAAKRNLSLLVGARAGAFLTEAKVVVVVEVVEGVVVAAAPSLSFNFLSRSDAITS